MDLKLRQLLLATVLPLQSLTVRYNRKFIFSRFHISLVLPVFLTGTFLDRYLFYLFISPNSRLIIQSLCLISLLCWWHCPLYCSLSIDSQSGLDRLANCSVHLKHWFLVHDLLLNPTKSEASYFGTWQPATWYLQSSYRYWHSWKLAYGNVEIYNLSGGHTPGPPAFEARRSGKRRGSPPGRNPPPLQNPRSASVWYQGKTNWWSQTPSGDVLWLIDCFTAHQQIKTISAKKFR